MTISLYQIRFTTQMHMKKIYGLIHRSWLAASHKHTHKTLNSRSSMLPQSIPIQQWQEQLFVADNLREECPSTTETNGLVLPGTFRSFNASYDQHYEKIGGGIGLMATYDRAGAGLLTTTSFSGVYSYVLPINKVFFLRGGLQASFVNKAIDHSKLRFGDQIHPTQGFVLPTQEPKADASRVFPNFAAGLLAYSEKFYAGFAMHNITEPVQSFYSNNDGIVPRRYTVHAGVVIPLDRKKFSQATFSPNALFMMQQNFTQINFGFYVNKGPIVTGLWYRQTSWHLW
jgi:type IX secretion system PorP/SprF family membrane protein